MRIEKVKNCGECRYFNPLSNLCIVLGGKVSKSATGCPANYIKPPTLFQEITASPEVLAEKLVYKKIDSFYCTSGAVVRWTSTISDWEYDTKSEAISATLAKLREAAE